MDIFNASGHLYDSSNLLHVEEHFSLKHKRCHLLYIPEIIDQHVPDQNNRRSCAVQVIELATGHTHLTTALVLIFITASVLRR